MGWIAVAVGGAVGSLARYGFGLWANQGNWPLGTWLVNVLGSFLIGFLYSYGKQQSWMSAELYLLLTTGMMGGFTTFSTFSLETLTMMSEGDVLKGIYYIFLSVGCGLTAAAIGWWMGLKLLRVLL